MRLYQPKKIVARKRPPETKTRNSPSFSYHARRSQEELTTGRQVDRDVHKQTGQQKQTLQFLLQRIGGVTISVVIVICVVSSLTLSSSPRIMPLSSGASRYFLHDTSTYQQAADALFSKSIWNRNKITIDTTGIESSLKQRFPELVDVAVTLPLLGHRPLVYVQSAEPALVLVSSSGSYVLDDRGKALLLASDVPGLANFHLPSVTDQSGLKIAADKTALPADNVRFIQVVIAELSARHVGVASLNLPPSTSELDVVPAGQSFYVKFNMQTSDSARQQAGTFLAMFSKLQSQNITPSKYVDVRVNGRAYYQ